jgi:hypothetical protein
VVTETYEEKLKNNFEWALGEAGMHFDETNSVHKTLRAITERLNQVAIPYAVVGAMAMFAHGYQRFTEAVDILVTRDDMQRLSDQVDGHNYVRPVGASTKLRDTRTGVRIEFLIAGQFPGDGKPKPIVFPDPAAVAVEMHGIRFANLSTLIELKLASGMSAPHRMKDLSDVLELIRALHLPRDFGEQLDAFVRPKFVELWNVIDNAPEE